MSRRLDFFTDLCWAEQKPILERFRAVKKKHERTLGRLFGCGFKFCTDCYTCGINHWDIDFLEIDFPFSPEAKEWRAMLAIWHGYYDYLADNDLEEYGEATANDPMEAVCLLLNKLIEVMPEKDKDVFRQAKAMLESRYQLTLKREAESEAFIAEHPEYADMCKNWEDDTMEM